MTEATTPLVKVGIGILIVKGDYFLFGKRKGSFGAGQWAFPGGHFEYGESFEECALREIKEECGNSLKVKNLRFNILYNMKEYWPKHYVHIGLVAEWDSGEPVNMEPEKLEGWEWVPLNAPPQPMFATTPAQLNAYRTGICYKDA